MSPSHVQIFTSKGHFPVKDTRTPWSLLQVRLGRESTRWAENTLLCPQKRKYSNKRQWQQQTTIKWQKNMKPASMGTHWLNLYDVAQCFSDFLCNYQQKHIIKILIYKPQSPSFRYIGLEWGLRLYIFLKSPGVSDSSGQWTSLWSHGPGLCLFFLLSQCSSLTFPVLQGLWRFYFSWTTSRWLGKSRGNFLQSIFNRVGICEKQITGGWREERARSRGIFCS